MFIGICLIYRKYKGEIIMDIINNQEFLTGVATNIVEDSIKGAWDKIKKFFKDLDAKDSIRYKTAYERYLINTKQKNSKIKTIIYRRAPKELYSFYECIGVSYNGKTINTENINNLFGLGNKIIVTGTGGIGKSILFKHLFLNTIEETGLIPVLIELRSFNICDVREISIFDTIYKSLCDNGFDLSKEYFEYSMGEGGYIIFLDGYDEVNRDKAEKVTSEIKALAEKYNNNRYFLSSRPSEEFIGWNDFCEVETLKLNKKQALDLIKKIEFDEVAKETFYKELDNSLYEKYESFASNPLLLNIMLLTFQKHASIPERLNDFYEEAFVTLFNVHDATKDSYVRDIRSGLGCEDFKLIFSYICFKSYFNGEFQFSEARLRSYIQTAKQKFDRFNFSVEDFQEDLTQSVCMLIKEGVVYHFSHRSFQEYFAAWYTCKLVDDIQSKLLLNWIKESESIFSDSYFLMLFDLQSEKVNKIILCPILKEIQKLYTQYGYSLEFLNNLFEGLRFNRRRTSEKKDIYSTSLTIKNKYLCYGLMLNNKLNKFPYGNSDNDAEKAVYEKVKIYFISNNKLDNNDIRLKEFSFNDILLVLSEEELLNHLQWFQCQVEFALQILEKYDDSNVNRKKRVSTILEEL